MVCSGQERGSLSNLSDTLEGRKMTWSDVLQNESPLWHLVHREVFTCAVKRPQSGNQTKSWLGKEKKKNFKTVFNLLKHNSNIFYFLLLYLVWEHKIHVQPGVMKWYSSSYLATVLAKHFPIDEQHANQFPSAAQTETELRCQEKSVKCHFMANMWGLKEHAHTCCFHLVGFNLF